MPAGFTSLPRELRDQIFRELLVNPTDYIDGVLSCRRKPKNITSGIFRVSKAFHQEATLVFYGENLFDFYYAWEFLEAIGPQNAGKIRSIMYPYCWYSTIIQPINDATLGHNGYLHVIQHMRRSCPKIKAVTNGVDIVSARRLSYLHLNEEYFQHFCKVLDMADTDFRNVLGASSIHLAMGCEGEAHKVPIWNERLVLDRIQKKLKELGWTYSVIGL